MFSAHHQLTSAVGIMSYETMASQLRKEKDIITIDDDEDDDDDDDNDIEIIGPHSFLRSLAFRSKPVSPISGSRAKNRGANQIDKQWQKITKTRDLPFIDPPIHLKSLTYNQISLEPGVNVELHNGNFMRITDIIQGMYTLKAFVRGWIFHRTDPMKDMLEFRPNEVCWILHVNENDSRDLSIQGTESVPISTVLDKRSLIMTSRPFPDLVGKKGDSVEQTTSSSVLVCRYKFVSTYKNAEDLEKGRWCERALCRISAKESDNFGFISDKELRQAWRGETIKKGACEGFLPGEVQYIQGERQCHNTAVEMRRKSLQRPSTAFLDLTKDNYIDLTDEGQDHGLRSTLLNKSKKSTKGSFTDFLSRQSREASLEIVEIRAQIDTTSKKGTFRREYESRITSSFLPNSSTRQQSKRPMDQLDSDPREERKRARGNSSLVSFGLNEKIANFPVQHFNNPYDNMQSKNLGNINSSTTLNKRMSMYQLDDAQERRYTYGDCFCGAGGTSRGAVEAGLRVEWGFDSDINACKSFQLNFVGSTVYNVPADQFSNLLYRSHKVDICHLSPPCQYYSDAHTIAGKNDERNIASTFAITTLLQKARPRVVTLEQTSGLLRRHPQFFNAVVSMLTSQGFSVRWKVLNFADFGLPQKRRRVIIIASCPGEALPEFPKPTHDKDPFHPGLKLWTTMNEAIDDIPPGWANHDVDAARKRDYSPRDGDTQAVCMTTSGAGICHPSGQRSLTHREYACIQGFPLEHKFSTNDVLKQIGNAVPPLFAKILFEQVKRALLKADGVLPE